MNILYITISILRFMNINLVNARPPKDNVGQEVEFKFEYFVGLIIRSGYNHLEDPEPFLDEERYYCGATILGNYWAVTTARCTQPFKEGFPMEGMFLRSGMIAWKDLTKPQRIIGDHNLQKIVPHDGFNPRNLRNDISLIKVVTPFIGDFAQRIFAAGRKFPYKTDEPCTVVGYGMLHSKRQKQDKLDHIQANISNHAECKDAYNKTVDWPDIIYKKNFCAWGPRVSEPVDDPDAECYLGSGGPIIQNNTLMGIVSFGEGCGLSRHPGVFTRINRFIGWFQKVEYEMKEGTGVTFLDK